MDEVPCHLSLGKYVEKVLLLDGSIVLVLLQIDG